MKAAVMRSGRLEVDEVADPTPGPGQVLVRTIACGICGSDLHALKHTDQMVEMSREMGAGAGDAIGMEAMVFDPDRDVVMGHEFSAEVVDVGPDAGGRSPGDVVVSMPLTMDQRGLHAIGYSNDYPGGYGELMVLSAGLALPVPNGLDPKTAALTEPMAVGVHAVNRSGVVPGDAALVVGAGPIGLAVIAALRQKGIEPVVAADFSSTRRQLAEAMGAHEVVDPRQERAVDAWRRVDGRKPLHVYEAVGVPGMIDQVMADAPRTAEIMVVGVCMQPDSIRPMLGIGKELTIRFALGYDPAEFAGTLTSIADGELPAEPLVTGSVALDGVPQAFDDLADPEAHAKILVVPAS